VSDKMLKAIIAVLNQSNFGQFPTYHLLCYFVISGFNLNSTVSRFEGDIFMPLPQSS